MKTRNKKKKDASKVKEKGSFVKVGENHCRHCIYSDEPTLSCAKLRCTYHRPKVIFHHKHGWVCYSFSEKSLRLNEMREERNLLNIMW